MMKSRPADYRLLAQALLVVGTARAGLYLLPFERLRRMAETPGRAMRVESVERIVWAVNAVSRRLMARRRCLVRALAVQWMMRRSGHEAQVRIGARMSRDGRLQAHAWVEQSGRVVTGGKHSPEIFAVFDKPGEISCPA